MLIYSSAYCTVVLIFFFPLFVWYVFSVSIHKMKHLCMYISLFFFLGEGFLWVACSPVRIASVDIGGRMEYTYITSKDLPSEILQAPCMVCACILTLANLNSVVYYLRVKIL